MGRIGMGPAPAAAAAASIDTEPGPDRISSLSAAAISRSLAS
jgi:hypothetical protein